MHAPVDSRGTSSATIALPGVHRNAHVYHECWHLHGDAAFANWCDGLCLQAEDRIHRLGQTEPCKVVYLIAEKTVEER